MKRIYLFIALILLTFIPTAIACDFAGPVCKKAPAAITTPNNKVQLYELQMRQRIWADDFGPLQTPASL